jgi:hypothetical protein
MRRYVTVIDLFIKKRGLHSESRFVAKEDGGYATVRLAFRPILARNVSKQNSATDEKSAASAEKRGALVNPAHCR